MREVKFPPHQLRVNELKVSVCRGPPRRWMDAIRLRAGRGAHTKYNHYGGDTTRAPAQNAASTDAAASAAAILSVIHEGLTDNREPGDDPVPTGVVLFVSGVVPKVAVLERREGVVGAVEGGAVVALEAVVAAGALELPPPVVVAASFFGWVGSCHRGTAWRRQNRMMRPGGEGGMARTLDGCVVVSSDGGDGFLAR